MNKNMVPNCLTDKSSSLGSRAGSLLEGSHSGSLNDAAPSADAPVARCEEESGINNNYIQMNKAYSMNPDLAH